MKLVKSKDHNKKEWVNIILESVADVLIYSALHDQIASKQAMNFWKELKATKNYDVTHGRDGYSDGIVNFMALELSLGLPIKSVFDYAMRADTMIAKAHKAMLEYAVDDKFVRVNKQGGFCSIEPEDLKTDEYFWQSEINEEQLFNYLLHETIEVDFKLSKPVLVIENGKHTPVNLIQTVSSKHGINIEDIQTITDFKVKTLMFNNADWFNFFEDGARNGLHTIVFETTAQDVTQINNLKKLLEHLPSLKHVTIYVNTFHNSTAKEFIQSLEYNKKKITLVLL